MLRMLAVLSSNGHYSVGCRVLRKSILKYIMTFRSHNWFLSLERVASGVSHARVLLLTQSSLAAVLCRISRVTCELVWAGTLTFIFLSQDKIENTTGRQMSTHKRSQGRRYFSAGYHDRWELLLTYYTTQELDS